MLLDVIAPQAVLCHGPCYWMSLELSLFSVVNHVTGCYWNTGCSVIDHVTGCRWNTECSVSCTMLLDVIGTQTVLSWTMLLDVVGTQAVLSWTLLLDVVVTQNVLCRVPCYWISLEHRLFCVVDDVTGCHRNTDCSVSWRLLLDITGTQAVLSWTMVLSLEYRLCFVMDDFSVEVESYNLHGVFSLTQCRILIRRSRL